METIERIKLTLNNYVVRYLRDARGDTYFCFCLDWEEAVLELLKLYPILNEDDLRFLFSENIDVKQGELCDFVSGKAKLARIINKKIIV